MARATGVQVTASTVRVVDIDGSPKKFRIRGYGEAAITPDETGDRDAAVTRATKEAFKSSKAGKEHVILGISASDCIVREITIPFTDVEQIRKVIKFESESHLHSCSIDEVVICFHKVAELGNRSTIMVVAAKKNAIQRSLEALEKAGVDPLAVDLDASGLFSMSSNLDELAEKKNYIVCDVGYATSLINVVVDGDLRVIRSVRMGTESITSRVSKDLDIGRDEAKTRTQAVLKQDIELSEDLLVQAGSVSDVGTETTKTADELERDIIRQRQSELVKRIQQEIYRTLNPANLEEPLECIYLVGPGSNLPRIHAELSEEMQLPVREIDIVGHMDHPFSVDESEVYNASLPVTCGLALKHLGSDALGFDFRQEEFVFARRFDRLKVPLVCMVVLLTALNLFWFLIESRQEQNRERTLRQVATRAAEQFGKAVDLKSMRASQRKVVESVIDAREVQKIYAGAAADNREPKDRIVYMGRKLKSIHEKLRKGYRLTQKSKSAKRGSSSSRGNRSSDQPADVSQFNSALRRLETVSKAIKDTGLKNFTLNSIRVKNQEVAFSVTLPESENIGGRQLTTTQIISAMNENLEATRDATNFLKLEESGSWKRRDDGRGLDYKFIARFKKDAL